MRWLVSCIFYFSLMVHGLQAQEEPTETPEMPPIPFFLGDGLYALHGIQLNGPGSLQLRHPYITGMRTSIADANSAAPTNRLYFRYVRSSDSSTSSFQVPGFGSGEVQSAQQLWLIGGEKTFLDDRASVEVRLPVYRGLVADPNFTFQADGSVSGFQETNEFGNASIITKLGLWTDSQYVVSAGVGVTIPTGKDVKVRQSQQVTGLALPNISTLGPVLNTLGLPLNTLPLGLTVLPISGRYQVDVSIENSTVTLSPYFSMLWMPSARSFVQTFVQLDTPLNSSRVEITGELAAQLGEIQSIQQLPVNRFSYRPQTALRADLALGYWLIERPGDRFLTGIAPVVEFHYYSTLDNDNPVGLTFNQLEAFFGQTNIQVGNPVNRIDFFNITVGALWQFGENLQLGTAYIFPISTGTNRSADGSFLVQLNTTF